MREKPTPSEGVKGDGKGKTVPQRIWRYCSYSTPSKGVTISLAFPTPSEGVNRQLPKPPVCASSIFGDNGSGSRLRAKHLESYRRPQLRADLKCSSFYSTAAGPSTN